MADAPERTSRALSPLWALLLLPLGLGAGVLLGHLPEPEVRAPAPAALIATAPVAAPRAASPDGPDPSAAAHAPSQVPAAPRVEESAWTTYSAALAESRRNGKPILLDFNAEWCPPCRMLTRQVFDHGEHGRAVREAVIPVSVVDRRREDGSNPAEVEELQRRHGIEAFPTLVVLDPVSGRSESQRGYGGAEATVEWIRRAARSVR
jgi:thiol:disulfide interchange protein